MRIVPPFTPDIQAWAENIRKFLGKALNQLDAKDQYSSASEDGALLWDRENLYPVVSKNGEWVPLAMGDFVPVTSADAVFTRSTDVTAAATDTAYAITYDAPSYNHKIDRDPTNNDRIVFEEAGQYLISFSANIRSTSGSDVVFYFWPRKNGTDVTGSTMVNTLHQNGSTLVVSRSSIFDFAANDYLQVMWAVDRTDGHLKAHGSTAFAPASPATTLTITRIHV